MTILRRGTSAPPQPTRMKPCNAAPSGLVSVLTYSLVRTIPSVTGHSGTIILHRVHVCMYVIYRKATVYVFANTKVSYQYTSICGSHFKNSAYEI